MIMMYHVPQQAYTLKVSCKLAQQHSLLRDWSLGAKFSISSWMTGYGLGPLLFTWSTRTPHLGIARSSWIPWKG